MKLLTEYIVAVILITCGIMLTCLITVGVLVIIHCVQRTWRVHHDRRGDKIISEQEPKETDITPEK